MPLNLRSGAIAGSTGTDPRQLSSAGTQTNPAPSDFETFVRKGISDIRTMLSTLEEALAYQDARTTELEKKVTPLEEKVKELEARILTHESRLQIAEIAENKLERFSRRNNFRIVGAPYHPNENALDSPEIFLRSILACKPRRLNAPIATVPK